MIKRLVRDKSGKSKTINLVRKRFINKPYELAVLDSEGKKVLSVRSVYIWTPQANEVYDDKNLDALKVMRNSLTSPMLQSLYTYAESRGLIKGSVLVLCRLSDLQRVSSDKASGINPYKVYDESQLLPIEEALRREMIT